MSENVVKFDRCEYVTAKGECGRVAVRTVGVDFTPYCELHIDEMQRRENLST